MFNLYYDKRISRFARNNICVRILIIIIKSFCIVVAIINFTLRARNNSSVDVFCLLTFSWLLNSIVHEIMPFPVCVHYVQVINRTQPPVYFTVTFTEIGQHFCHIVKTTKSSLYPLIRAVFYLPLWKGHAYLLWGITNKTFSTNLFITHKK